jgi:hypothetical protein
MLVGFFVFFNSHEVRFCNKICQNFIVKIMTLVINLIDSFLNNNCPSCIKVSYQITIFIIECILAN